MHLFSSARLCPLLLALVAAAPGASAQSGDIEELVSSLREKRDLAEVKLVFDLANMKSREAMEGLLEVYGVMESVFMRRAVVQGLAYMDGVDDAEQPALQKIMDVATGAGDRELREAAVDALSTCRHLGRAFLAMIVDAPADDEIRERAMRYHVHRPRAEDMDWYRRFYRPGPPLSEPEPPRDKRRRGRDEGEDEAPKLPRQLEVLRQLAFEAQVGQLEEEDLKRACRDGRWRIRDRALVELEQRNSDVLEEFAETAYANLSERPEVRLTAAGILVRIQGAELAEDLIDDAGRLDTSLSLRLGIADLLAGMQDPKVEKQLVKLVGRGKKNDKLFALWAVRGLPQDKKLDKDLRKGLRDKDSDVVRITLDVLALRGDVGALKDVERLYEKSKEARVRAAALDCLCTLRGLDESWVEALAQEARGEDAELRNAALMQLGKAGAREQAPLMLEQLEHEQWSTRLAALRALEELRQAESLGPIISRMAHEAGRMEIEFSETLWRLTALPFGKNALRWQQWWEEEGAGFELVSESMLAKSEREREVQRLKQISKSTFFGLRIESHRVTFIVDVSGSMEEMTAGRYRGEEGEKRIAVAKEELLACLESLDGTSLFNIIVFSDRVRSWSERISEITAGVMEDAREYVADLKAGGATNLYAALEVAFEDPDVDTIFVLSDGEPTVDPTDPELIRQRVAAWNRHRDVTIHCVAVGGNLQILEWLAEDTGGTYVRHP